MFVFAFAADARGGEAAARRVRGMMAARGGDPDAVVFANAPNAAAGLARWSVSARDDRAAPIWDPERQLLVTGDVRLYNRRELLAELGSELRDPAAPDLALAHLGYARWGRQVCSRLVGDFAFVVWDERARAVFAARDHLGVRPLYRHETPEGLVLASDVRQILCLVPRVSSLVDDQKVLDRFTRKQRTHGRTFFRGVTMVRPGHCLEAQSGRAREVRHWFPPDPDGRASYAEHCEIFLATFERAVRDRLESDRPLVAHSSGGFDSSSIILAAERIYGEGGTRPPLIMASALSPGMPSDESHLMDVVARRVRFEGHRWNALEPTTADIDDPLLGRPGQRRGLGGGPRGDVLLARSRGARVLLTGGLGDNVMFAWGLRRELFRRGRWGTLLRGTVGRDGLRDGGRKALKASLGALSPVTALWLGERAFGRPGPPPRWFGPRLRKHYPPPPEQLDTLDRSWPSHLACELWARVTSPQSSACVDGPVQSAGNDGLEVRIPYSDVRLVEAIFRIPAAQRVDRGSVWALRHDTVGRQMPRELLTRRGQPSWATTFGHAARQTFPRVAELLEDGDWLSAPYCDRAELRRWLVELTQQGQNAPARDCMTVADLGTLEAWLRHVLRYDANREVVE